MSGDQAACDVPHGALLIEATETLLGQDEMAKVAIRETLISTLGPEMFSDICATLASFNAVVKLADGAGIPLEPEKAEKTADIREQLNIEEISSFDKES